jgi:hypothetical protein
MTLIAALAVLKKPVVWVTLVTALVLLTGYVWLAPKYGAWRSGRAGLDAIDRTMATINAFEKDKVSKDKAIIRLSEEIVRLRRDAAAHQANVAALQKQIDGNQAARASLPAPKSLRDATEALRALYP